jgi:hypothetical protein
MIAGNVREATEAEVSSFSNSNGNPVYVLTNESGRFTFTDVPWDAIPSAAGGKAGRLRLGMRYTQLRS